MSKGCGTLAAIVITSALSVVDWSAAQDTSGYLIIVGDRYGAPTPVQVGSLLEIPVWGATPSDNLEDSVAFMHIPLATNDSFVVARRGGNYPDTLMRYWEDRVFLRPNPDLDSGWTNQSFYAICLWSGRSYLFCTGGDTVLFCRFRMVMSADSFLAGDTITPFKMGYEPRNQTLMWGMQDGLTEAVPTVSFSPIVLSSSEDPSIYVPGDINENGLATGVDVVYAVSYFKGGPPPRHVWDCPGHGNLYVAGDVNGDCAFNGLDISYFVSYFKGGPEIYFCSDCPPEFAR